MIDLVSRYILPASYSLLPAAMQSRNATAMLLSVGLQESGFTARRQQFGPARSFWMFEVNGVRAVLKHARSRAPIEAAIIRLGYGTLIDEGALQEILEHNDVLAAAFARCLLWTVPGPLPGPDDSDLAWTLYQRGWRPGKPRRLAWTPNYRAAWAHVTVSEGPPV